jgi:hypothetical protein
MMRIRHSLSAAVLLVSGFVMAQVSAHADDADELAKKVSNPASFMISVPVHSDSDFANSSAGHGFYQTLDIEPVIPFSLNADWNLISHTDIPFAYSDPAGPDAGRFGLGDISQNLSFTPSSHGAFIWAFGPQLSFPTATNAMFGSGKFSAGPSGLLLLQTENVTTGASFDHMWSLFGSSGRPDVNQSEVQPFIAWHIGKGRTISASLDASYDWTGGNWSLPASVSFSKIVKIGEQTVSLSIGGKYWIEGPDQSPEWGIKSGITFLFPSGRTKP